MDKEPGGTYVVIQACGPGGLLFPSCSAPSVNRFHTAGV